jgi:ribosomal protein L33
MRSFLFCAVFIALACFSASSCKSRNYITYYNKSNTIDSVYKINRDTIAFIKRYKKLFKKYNPPKSYSTFDKYETYIVFSDKYSKNFGKKKSLYKLLVLVAPYSEHYKTLIPLCAKYGIDSLSVEQKIADSKSNMNKQLIDSFSVAFVRDQHLRRSDPLNTVKNDRINARLLKWTIENYGYPSPQKIGMTGNNGVFMPMLTFLSHMGGGVPEYYPYFKDTLLLYVKSGECSPREYATMIDRHEHENKREILYGEYLFNFSDLKKVNRNRRSIGLKSLIDNVKK